MADYSTLSQLIKAQSYSLEQTSSKITQFEKFRNDYCTLSQRLSELSKQVSQRTILPFGKKACVHGRYVHTNEIYAFIGASYFTLVSSHEAKEMIQRRISKLDLQINNLSAQKHLLESRVNITQNLKEENRHDQGVVEIKEDYDPVKETEWRQQHKKYLKQTRSNRNDFEKTLDDAILMRLEELEKEEAEEERVGKQLTENHEEEKEVKKVPKRKSCLKDSNSAVLKTNSRQVLFDEPNPSSQSINAQDESDDLDSSDSITNDDSDDNVDNYDHHNISSTSKVITFSHSSVPSPHVTPSHACFSTASGDTSLFSPISPADIGLLATSVSSSSSVTSSSSRPYTDTVIDRSTLPNIQEPSTSNSTMESTRPISKFRSMRSGR